MNTQELSVSLDSCLQQGQVVDRNWLKDKGFNRPLVDYYVRCGTLQLVTRGMYCRPGPPLKWEHIVYSLQQLGVPCHVGGRSALDLQGMAHYLSLQGVKQIHLYGMEKLPGWVNRIDQRLMAAPVEFVYHKLSWFNVFPNDALTGIPFGHWDWPVIYAKAELALLELAADIKTVADFDFLNKYFESATALRPKLIRELLLSAKHVKAKRLFLWFAKRQGYAWFNKVDLSGIDLGSGKRVVLEGGALDSDYQITVPRNMVNGSEQSFF